MKNNTGITNSNVLKEAIQKEKVSLESKQAALLDHFLSKSKTDETLCVREEIYNEDAAIGTNQESIRSLNPEEFRKKLHEIYMNGYTKGICVAGETYLNDATLELGKQIQKNLEKEYQRHKSCVLVSGGGVAASMVRKMMQHVEEMDN